jgi:hypothetical protein
VTLDAFIDGAADTLILLGIFCTALFSVFRVGRWVQSLLDAQAAMNQTLTDHIAEEDIQFAKIDKALKSQVECVRGMRADVTKLQSVCQNGGG